MLDAAIAMAAHPPRHCVVVQRERLRCDAGRGPRSGLGTTLMARRDARRRRARRRHRSALRALHLGDHRQAQGHRARQRRARGGTAVDACATSTTSPPATCSGRPRMSAGWSATPTSSTDRCWLGATTVLYEGKPVGTPDPGAFWRVIAEHGVKALFTAPTAIRAIRKEDPDGHAPGRYDLSGAEVSVPGRRTARSRHVPLGDRRNSASRSIDHWWQTETGWAIAANPMGVEPLPHQGGIAHRADAGLRRAHPARRRLPLRDRRGGRHLHRACRCRRARCRRCGTTTPATRRPTCPSIPATTSPATAADLDEDGYLFVMGRIDDVINVAGHRLSTGAIEDVLATHPAVAECAVIGVRRRDQGSGAARIRRAQGRRVGRRPRRRAGEAGARRDRRRRVLQAGGCGSRAAEDTIGQDLAQDDARHRGTATTNRCPRPSRTSRCWTRCGRSCWAATELELDNTRPVRLTRNVAEPFVELPGSERQLGLSTQRQHPLPDSMLRRARNVSTSVPSTTRPTHTSMRDLPAQGVRYRLRRSPSTEKPCLSSSAASSTTDCGPNTANAIVNTYRSSMPRNCLVLTMWRLCHGGPTSRVVAHSRAIRRVTCPDLGHVRQTTRSSRFARR